MTETTPLEKEFQYYLDHQAELAQEYAGKVIVLKDCEVIGVFEDELEAVEETSKAHPLGTFLVQRCDPDPESTVQTFHSRVHFAR